MKSSSLRVICWWGYYARLVQHIVHTVLHKEEHKKRSADAHKLADLKRRRKQILRRLETKGMVKLMGSGDDAKILIQKKGNEYARIQALVHAAGDRLQDTWDKQWTLVMFDMPSADSALRQQLTTILRSIGFVSVQLSNYVYPYPVPELVQFLQDHPRMGQYCHVFRGTYEGDDQTLRTKFKL